MTYCLGILLPAGLVLASDSRSNAGVDQINLVNKLDVLANTNDRMIAIMSAGNLATSQAVISTLREHFGTGDPDRDLLSVRSLFAAAECVGAVLREVIAKDGEFVQPYGDPTATFLVGGQIKGEAHRLFEIYAAGNFVEASTRTPFLKIGETKYGKPILDRALATDSTLDTAAMLALISFDATIRSNLSVEAPIDLLRYEADSFSSANLVTFERDDPYWTDLRKRYSDGLMALIETLPLPPVAPAVSG